MVIYVKKNLFPKFWLKSNFYKIGKKEEKSKIDFLIWVSFSHSATQGQQISIFKIYYFFLFSKLSDNLIDPTFFFANASVFKIKYLIFIDSQCKLLKYIDKENIV